MCGGVGTTTIYLNLSISKGMKFLIQNQINFLSFLSLQPDGLNFGYF